jgi:hypothetical protein
MKELGVWKRISDGVKKTSKKWREMVYVDDAIKKNGVC